jgi:transcriptional regulator with XRE-family HTH domain
VAQDFLRTFGERVRQLRIALGISQEELAHRSGLDRTYISDIERGQRNIGLLNVQTIASGLTIDPAELLVATKSISPSPPTYRLRSGFAINRGFPVIGEQVVRAALATADDLAVLPFSLFHTIDLKTLSSIGGALFATHLAREVGAIVNPIEKGHPDILPVTAAEATESQLRNYPAGLEVKCTVGNVESGSNLHPGEPRVDSLTGITWQAHHQDVRSLMALLLDFAGLQGEAERSPIITGVFYSENLLVDDWGKISGTTGRNTKVCGMRSSGKKKLGAGWVLLLDDDRFVRRYGTLLNFEA